MKPSRKALERDFPGKGKELRRALDSLAYCESLPAVEAWVRSCYNRPSDAGIRMAALDAILEGFGVEYVKAGSNARSPAFRYVNMGDTYNVTIVRFSDGRYRISDYGSIVERGSYE